MIGTCCITSCVVHVLPDLAKRNVKRRLITTFFLSGLICHASYRIDVFHRHSFRCSNILVIAPFFWFQTILSPSMKRSSSTLDPQSSETNDGLYQVPLAKMLRLSSTAAQSNDQEQDRCVVRQALLSFLDGILLSLSVWKRLYKF